MRDSSLGSRSFVSALVDQGTKLGGGFKEFLFSPLFGEDSQLTNIFQRG